MSVLECFVLGDFLVGDPPPYSYIFRHLSVKDLFFSLQIKHAQKYSHFRHFQYVLKSGKHSTKPVIREKASLFLFDIYLEKYCCNPFTENLCCCGYISKTMFLWSRVLLAGLRVIMQWTRNFTFRFRFCGLAFSSRAAFSF